MLHHNVPIPYHPQAKLDQFYDTVEVVQQAHIVEKGHRGQWDIDTTKHRSSGCGLAMYINSVEYICMYNNTTVCMYALQYYMCAWKNMCIAH